MPKIKIFRSDIKKLLDSLPPNLKVPLKKDPITAMNTDQIMQQIDEKTPIGKQYYLQLVEVVYKKKKDKTWKKFGEGEGTIL